MTKETQFLQENKMGYLATTDQEGHARVRMFGITVSDEGLVSFGTSPNGLVYEQLKANPNVEFIASKGVTTLRVSGKIVFEENQDIINAIIESVPQIKAMYAGRENEFKPFYMPEPSFKWFTWQ